MSQSCDQVTGSCDCQEGAVGEKCDDCAFGFTGKTILYIATFIIRSSHSLISLGVVEHSYFNV